MTVEECKGWLDDMIARAAENESPERPDNKIFAGTFVGQSSRGLPVRPEVLSRTQDGERVYGITLRQARKWRKALES